MTEPSSQPTGTGSDPEAISDLGQALETPQAAPAVQNGPDSHSLPRSVKPQAAQDYKARYDGLNTRYQADRATWESRVQELEEQVAQLSKPAPEQKLQAAEGLDTPSTDVLDQAIRQRKAETYRNLLVESMAKELGLPALEVFADHIPVVAPELTDDGIDDSAQRAAIKGFADKLRGVQGEASQRTQSAIMEGMTPGSAPGAGAPAAGDDLYQEFLELMEVQGTAEFARMDAADQRRIEKRYFELLETPAVQGRHEGQTAPTMSWQEMQQTVRDLVKRMGPAQGRGQTPFGNMA